MTWDKIALKCKWDNFVDSPDATVSFDLVIDWIINKFWKERGEKRWKGLVELGEGFSDEFLELKEIPNFGPVY